MTDVPEAPTPDVPAVAARGPRLARTRRWLRGVGVVLASVVAAALVAALAIDVGPSLKGQAERRGSALIQRPLHIGRLSVNLLRGHFTFEDLRIEGLTPADEPFFTAKTIVVILPWWTLARGEIFIESVTIDDWRMVIASLPGQPEQLHQDPDRRPAHRAQALHHDHPTGAREERRAGVHRLRGALEHHRTQPRCDRGPAERLPRRGTLPERHRHDHELRAHVGEPLGRVQDRWRPGPRSTGSTSSQMAR